MLTIARRSQFGCSIASILPPVRYLRSSHQKHRRLGRIFKAHFRLLQSAAAGPCVNEQAHILVPANGEDDLIALRLLDLIYPRAYDLRPQLGYYPDNSIASSAMVPLHANRVQLVYPRVFP